MVGTYLRPVGNDNKELVEYLGTDIDYSTLTKGGQLTTEDPAATITGDELKVINSEHVIYGYAGTTTQGGAELQGDLITPNGEQSPFKGTLPEKSQVSSSKYVQSGIIGNTGTKGENATDPSKNIYGVSAKDGNNITVLTGNGIALGNLANNGQLQEDGRVVTANGVLVGNPTQSQALKSREYEIGGKTYVKTYNDDPGQEVAAEYYEVVGNSLVKVDGTNLEPQFAALDPNRSGTASSITGNFRTASTKNTITNQNVTYSEETKLATQTTTTAGITNSSANGETVVTNTTAAQELSSLKQSVVTGIIAQDADKNNVYGVEVKKETSTTGEDGNKVTTTAKTTITADYVDSGDFRINGVSIVDNIKTSVDEAVGGATEALDAKVAEVDVKIAEVDTRLTQFNTTANRLNQRISDVEETAYRGVAIALAAQQQVPNIGAGQFAVFGGVGHYEGESAAALGLASVLADGRTSFSAALGAAGNGEVGGRVGMAYVFGGK